MRNYFTFSAFIYLFLHLAGFSSADLHDTLVGYLAANRIFFMGSGLLTGLGFVGFSFVFSSIGSFTLMFAVARIFYELAKVLICAMVLGAVIFWLDIDVNFWLEGGMPLVVVLYAWLYGAAFSMQRIDFNYPVRQTLLRYSSLIVICLGVMYGWDLFA
ncbi:hypothetical protein ACUUL3_06815 [Thiovibrio sp. JS02]